MEWAGLARKVRERKRKEEGLRPKNLIIITIFLIFFVGALAPYTIYIDRSNSERVEVVHDLFLLGRFHSQRVERGRVVEVDVAPRLMVSAIVFGYYVVGVEPAAAVAEEDVAALLADVRQYSSMTNARWHLWNVRRRRSCSVAGRLVPLAEPLPGHLGRPAGLLPKI